MSRSVCTIIASNYLQQAEVLFASLKVNNPDDSFYCLILDEPNSIDIENVSILSPNQIIHDKRFLKSLSFKYDVVEFATAMKPYLLKFLMETGNFSEVLFLDPDILVLSKIPDHFPEPYNSYCAILTPHRFSITALQDKIYYDIEILRTGYFNLGFIAINTQHIESLNFLDWWISRVNQFALRIPFLPFFTDQKWIDLAFHIFPMQVCKHPGYNVAPWNVDERKISLKGEILFAGSQLIVFIHFSQVSESIKLGNPLKYWGKASPEGLGKELNTILSEHIVEPYSKLLEKARLNKVEFSRELKASRRNLHRSLVLKSYLHRKSILGKSPNALMVRLLSSSVISWSSRSFLFSLALLGARKDVLRLKKKLKISHNLELESLYLP